MAEAELRASTILAALSSEIGRQGVREVAQLDLVAMAATIERALDAIGDGRGRPDEDGLEPDELSAANDG